MIKDEFTSLTSKNARWLKRNKKKGHCYRCGKKTKLVTLTLCAKCREYRNNYNRTNILKPRVPIPIWESR